MNRTTVEDDSVRKERWKKIRRRLRRRGDELASKRWLDELERYYFGDHPPVELGWTHLPLTFRMAFHPTSGPAHWTEMCAKSFTSDVRHARSYLNPYWHEEDPLFGEKDAALCEFFFPEEPRTIMTKNGELPLWFYERYEFRQWWDSIRVWLTHPPTGARPVATDKVDWMWEQMPEAIEDALTLSTIRQVMVQCANFVPPIGLQGDDIPQRRFTDLLRNGLGTRELPEDFEELWDAMKTRKGRSKLWIRKLIGAGRTDRYERQWGFETMALLDVPVTSALLRELQACLHDLGFAVSDKVSGLQAVDLSGHITEDFRRQLGIDEGEACRGWRLRVKTTPDYVDSNTARIELDILTLFPGEKARTDVPTLLVVQRPSEPYSDIVFARAYELNERLFRRTFEAAYGTRPEKLRAKARLDGRGGQAIRVPSVLQGKVPAIEDRQ